MLLHAIKKQTGKLKCTMEIEIFGKERCMHIRLNKDRQRERHELSCSHSDVSTYTLDEDQKKLYQELKDFSKCVTSKRCASEWGGRYGYSTLDRIATSSPIDRIKFISDSIDREKDEELMVVKSVPVVDCDFVLVGLDYFGNTSDIDFALVSNHPQVLRTTAYCFNEQEVRSAVVNIYLGLRYLHSLGIVHLNITREAIVYNPKKDIFMITDLYCAQTCRTCKCEVNERNALYSWLRDVCVRMDTSGDDYNSLLRQADCFAALSVIRYLATMDDIHLTDVDTRDVTFVRNSPSNDALIMKSLENLISGMYYLDIVAKTLEIGFTEGIVSMQYVQDKLKVPIEVASNELTATAKDILSIETTASICSKYIDSKLFSPSLLEKILPEPNECVYSFKLRKRLSLLIYNRNASSTNFDADLEKYGSESLFDYLVKSEGVEYFSIAKANVMINSIS